MTTIGAFKTPFTEIAVDEKTIKITKVNIIWPNTCGNMKMYGGGSDGGKVFRSREMTFTSFKMTSTESGYAPGHKK